jgi:autonomous glycyl radical cofactor GrcA
MKMKKMIVSSLFVSALSLAAFAQDSSPKPSADKMHGKDKKTAQTQEAKPDKMKTKGETGETNDENKPVDLKAGEKITRGGPLTGAEKVSLADALANPSKYAGKTVSVSGVIVRSCKMEGCWMELAPSATAKAVRVKMKDHDFFIPLNAAGLNATAEGTLEVKNLSKAEVEHLVKEDGAKFDKINADGSVTEVAFTANGVELVKK